ncbi:MAG: hypothetical protein ACYDA6_10595 [Solirubrobacteraceae bacterium]
MIVVADASVLVGELLRRRGRALLLHRDLHVVVAEDQWEEAAHELSKRLAVLESRHPTTGARPGSPLRRRPAALNRRALPR